MPIVDCDNGIILPHALDKIKLCWWKITETEAKLRELYAKGDCELSTGKIPQFGSSKRTKEWIAARLLFSCLCPNMRLGALSSGAPIVEGHPDRYISISHSGKFVCLAEAPYKIGIDIEQHSDKAHKLQTRFLTPTDKIEITSETVATIAWSAKESAYKFASNSGISLQEGIVFLSHDIKRANIDCEIVYCTNTQGHPCTIKYNDFPSFVFTICSARM